MLWFVNGCVWLPSTRHAYQRALDSKTSTTTSTRFSVLSSARVVILAGKRESRRHSNTSFRENVVAAKTSYQLLGILSFSDRERASPPSTEISVLTFVVQSIMKKANKITARKQQPYLINLGNTHSTGVCWYFYCEWNPSIDFLFLLNVNSPERDQTKTEN